MEKKNVERGREEETRARLEVRALARLETLTSHHIQVRQPLFCARQAAAKKKFALTKPQLQRLLGEMGVVMGDIEMTQLVR